MVTPSFGSLELPACFCWTRYGVESGEKPEDIIARKDRERAANNGLFLWGIGNSVATSIRELLRREADPYVLFSPIKSLPRAIDSAPTSVVTWSYGEALDGRRYDLPSSSTVTSRFDWVRRKSHYALVCYSPRSLMSTVESRLSVDASALKNVVSGRPLGFSQVTAVVVCTVREGSRSYMYDITFRANLVAPYFIILRGPRPIDGESRRQSHHGRGIEVFDELSLPFAGARIPTP
jgi:hypothetical protein